MKKMMSIFMVAVFFLLLPNFAFAEKQPRMRAALELLKKAEYQLKHVTHDKGGHAVSALKHTRAAIRQVKKGIKFDRRHLRR